MDHALVVGRALLALVPEQSHIARQFLQGRDAPAVGVLEEGRIFCIDRVPILIVFVRRSILLRMCHRRNLAFRRVADRQCSTGCTGRQRLHMQQRWACGPGWMGAPIISMVRCATYPAARCARRCWASGRVVALARPLLPIITEGHDITEADEADFKRGRVGVVRAQERLQYTSEIGIPLLGRGAAKAGQLL